MISPHRLETMLEAMRHRSGPGEGAHRLAFTDMDWEGRSYIIDRMKELGLTVRTDAFGNVIGRWEGLDSTLPAVAFGSHCDSVPNGGHFDGVFGVVGALEVVASLQEEGFQPEHPLEVILFMCEESSRFGSATLGSKAMRGLLSHEELHRLQDENGHSLYDVLLDRGLQPDDLPSAHYKDPVKAFLELHIEQGKVLEQQQQSIGIVTGIAAAERLQVTIQGQADHSGATPMGGRRDALCGAAEIILAVEHIGNSYTDIPIVATSSTIQALPGAINVIPGEVHLGIDLRSIDLPTRQQANKDIREAIAHISETRQLTMHIDNSISDVPVRMHPSIMNLIESTTRNLGYAYCYLPSGAGHDAMHWPATTPTGMIFVPCRDGISHSPQEFAHLEDLVKGAEVLRAVVQQLAKKDTIL